MTTIPDIKRIELVRVLFFIAFLNDGVILCHSKRVISTNKKVKGLIF